VVIPIVRGERGIAKLLCKKEKRGRVPIKANNRRLRRPATLERSEGARPLFGYASSLVGKGGGERDRGIR